MAYSDGSLSYWTAKSKKKKYFLGFHSGANTWLELKVHQTITNSRLCNLDRPKGNMALQKRKGIDITSP